MTALVVGDTVQLTAKAAKGLTTRHKPKWWDKRRIDAWSKDAERAARRGEVVRISRDRRTVHVCWDGRKSPETYAPVALEIAQ